MLISLHHLRRFEIHATDGVIGEVDDFLFDDRDLVVRYLVVRTGRFLKLRRVLVAPGAVGPIDGRREEIRVDLDREAIEACPPLDADRPLHLQLRAEAIERDGWPLYWTVPNAFGLTLPPALPVDAPQEDGEDDEPSHPRTHLRSTEHVLSYRIHAEDGLIGHAVDLIADTDGWRLRHLVASTRSWLPGRHVLIPLVRIRDIDWASGEFACGLTRQEVKESPPFDPDVPINRVYEERLYDYYGRPHRTDEV